MPRSNGNAGQLGEALIEVGRSHSIDNGMENVPEARGIKMRTAFLLEEATRLASPLKLVTAASMGLDQWYAVTGAGLPKMSLHGAEAVVTTVMVITAHESLGSYTQRLEPVTAIWPGYDSH